MKREYCANNIYTHIRIACRPLFLPSEWIAAADAPTLSARATAGGQLVLDLSCSASLESFLTVSNATLYMGSAMLSNVSVNTSLNGSISYLANNIRLAATLPVSPLNDSLAVQYSVGYTLGVDSDIIMSSTKTLDFYLLFFCMHTVISVFS